MIRVLSETKIKKVMKTTKIKYTAIVILAVLMSTFTMFNSFADGDTIKAKKSEVLVKIDIDTVKKNVAELENLIKDLLTKYDYLNINITANLDDENEIEAWMLNNNYFEDEAEENEIEDWMLSEDHFEDDSSDTENEIEDWMLNSNYFEDETEENTVEDWMLDKNYFNK